MFPIEERKKNLLYFARNCVSLLFTNCLVFVVESMWKEETKKNKHLIITEKFFAIKGQVRNLGYMANAISYVKQVTIRIDCGGVLNSSLTRH